MERWEERYQKFVVEAGADLLRPDFCPERLLVEDHSAFVDQAFRIFIGRPAGPEDLRHHLPKIHGRRGRLDVVLSVRYSAEAQKTQKIWPDSVFERALRIGQRCRRYRLPGPLRGLILAPYRWRLRQHALSPGRWRLLRQLLS